MSGDAAEFGPYTLTRLIGRGGMGEVYEAYDRAQDRQVAVKRLIAHLADDVEFQRRFRRESRIAARLRNPHVVPIHRYGEIDKQLYIEMRLVEGPNLEDLLYEQGRLDPERAVNVIEQVASALDAAHADGLIHRDVKPSNVLVDRASSTYRDFVYLADFGITRAGANQESQALTTSHAIIGSLDYMAPEQFEGTVGREMDIYALGCVFFECLTGRRPFEVDGLPALMHAHLHVGPPRPSQSRPDLPRELDDVVARAMSKQPADRYPTAGMLAADAQRVLAGLPTIGIAMGGPVSTPLDGQEVAATGEPAAARQGSSVGVGENGRGAPSTNVSHEAVDGPPQSSVLTGPVPDGDRDLAANGETAPDGAVPAPPYLDETEPAGSGGRRRGRMIAAAVATVAVLAGAAFGVHVLVDARSSTYEPLFSAGSAPFTAPVGTDNMTTQPVANAAGVFRGDTPSLFAADPARPSCDVGALVSALQSAPDRATAWAGTLGTTADRIQSLVDSLSAVTLRSDTAVVDHGFADGAVTATSAVLAPGTAVLVDSRGLPTVKCRSGDPLTPPSSGPATATVIQPSAEPITMYVFLNPATGRSYTSPGKPDRPGR